MTATDTPNSNCISISALELPTALYTQLDTYVLAVLHRRLDGWCVYVGAVPGHDHANEWQGVLRYGNKQPPAVAEAIARHLFHPGLIPDGCPYAL